MKQSNSEHVVDSTENWRMPAFLEKTLKRETLFLKSKKLIVRNNLVIPVRGKGQPGQHPEASTSYTPELQRQPTQNQKKCTNLSLEVVHLIGNEFQTWSGLVSDLGSV